MNSLIGDSSLGIGVSQRMDEIGMVCGFRDGKGVVKDQCRNGKKGDFVDHK